MVNNASSDESQKTARAQKLSQTQNLVSQYSRDFETDNPNSLAQYKKAGEVLPGGITRSTLYYSPFPLTIERGEGVHIWDIDGHRYVNLVGEYSAGVYGHNPTFLHTVLEEISKKGLMLSGPIEFEEKLARIICSKFPSCELVRFCNSGTEANLLAIGLARKYTNKDAILVFTRGYHGGVLTFPTPLPRLNVPFKVYQSSYNNLDQTRAIIQQHADDIAAIIVEPMLGSGGCIPAQTDFLKLLREESTKNEIVLIYDEVLTSRLDPGGLQSVYNIIPDVTTLGKYIGGGFSIGAVGGSRDIMGLLDQKNPDYLPHYGTFNNNIASMIAGYIGLNEYYTAEHINKLNSRGDRLRKRLNDLIRSRSISMQFTGIGAVMTSHFTSKQITSPGTQESPEVTLLKRILHLYMLRQGYYTAERGLITLNLMLEDEHIDRFVDTFSRFLFEHDDLIKNIDK